MLGLIVTINKFKSYFSSIVSYTTCDTIEEAKKELTTYLAAHLNNLNIDYPMELSDFEYLWFNQSYVNANAFTYKIFQENKWIEPWTLDEIYEDVLERMHNEEIKSAPDFSRLYGEPVMNSDDEAEAPDFFADKKNTDEVEKELKKYMKIISEQKDLSELQCNCGHCDEHTFSENQPPKELEI